MPNTANQPSRALWYAETGQAVLRPIVTGEVQEGEVRVKSAYGAISKGTESLVFHGQVPEREYARMRAPFQEGNFPYPVKYGYATVGTIVEGPETMCGKTVFCLYPHQNEFVVPVSAVTQVPPEVPASRAVLAANMETAVNAVWDADLSEGSTISVIGAGVVGLLIGYVARLIADCPVEIIDIDQNKADAAAALGLDFAHPDQASIDRAVVFHASATSAGLTSALRACCFEGKVIEVSWFGDKHVSVPLGEDFHSRRLTIVSSQVGSVARPKREFTSHSDRLAFALSLLDNPALDVLFNHDISFASLPAALPPLFAAGSQALCPRIVY